MSFVITDPNLTSKYSTPPLPPPIYSATARGRSAASIDQCLSTSANLNNNSTNLSPPTTPRLSSAHHFHPLLRPPLHCSLARDYSPFSLSSSSLASSPLGAWAPPPPRSSPSPPPPPRYLPGGATTRSPTPLHSFPAEVQEIVR